MALRIVNPDPKYSTVALAEPAALGYIYIGATVRPSGRLPLVWPNADRSALLHQLKVLARRLELLDPFLKATVFRAIVQPPTARFSGYLKARGPSLHVADFDVIVLIETASPASARELQTTPTYHALIEAVLHSADAVHIVAARNARRIADVDKRRPGLFLFNHFAADDPGTMLQLWDHLADWYVKETGLDNSEALVPVEGEKCDYAIINTARWDSGPLAHFARQLSTRTFWSYVVANLEANHAASMPIYCRLA
jgi:hypothetical protein